MTPIPHIKSPWRTLSLLLGFAFLYAPILILIIIYTTALYGRRVAEEAGLNLQGVEIVSVEHSHAAAEVAAASGLTDQSHLTRAFTRRYGITPVRYQKQVARR